jgi:hypothetical protein
MGDIAVYSDLFETAEANSLLVILTGLNRSAITGYSQLEALAVTNAILWQSRSILHRRRRLAIKGTRAPVHWHLVWHDAVASEHWKSATGFQQRSLRRAETPTAASLQSSRPTYCSMGRVSTATLTEPDYAEWVAAPQAAHPVELGGEDHAKETSVPANRLSQSPLDPIRQSKKPRNVLEANQ